MKIKLLSLCVSLWALLLLSIFTPLGFTSGLLAYFVFGAAMALPIVISRMVEKQDIKYMLRFVPIAAVAFVSILFFMNPFANNPFSWWKTVSISHRSNGGLQYIAHQFRDMGGRGYARRTCKVTTLFPGFAYIVDVDTTEISSGWTKVSEDYNPFNWK